MNDPKPTPGSRLKAERELRGLSAQKAADELHLDAWVIDALEAGDYARIGPTVYAKGHLRKYANMLGLPLAEIMTDFEPQQAGAPSRDGSSIPVGSRHGAAGSRRVSLGQAAASLVALILLIGLVWWQPWHQRTRGPDNRGPATRAPAGGAPASTASVSPEQGTAANVDPSDGPAVPISAQDYAPGAAAPGAASPGATASAGTPAAGTPAAGTPSAMAAPPGAGRARLRLSFSSDSWVDVRDALGNRAYTGNGSANTVKTIAGNAPLHVYLRSANGVQLEINGRAVAIGPQFFSGDVARFEAGADGVLRRDTSREPTRPEQTPARPPG
jgi:cytoskeleton protein RodZ